jgi:CubicO group peptidase (beta-lactamase class C family)
MKLFQLGIFATRTFGVLVAGGFIVGSLLAGRAVSGVATPACVEPAVLDDGWPTATPEAAGFDSAALCVALDDVTRDPANIHGVIVERHGRLVAELYRRGKDRSNGSLFAREVEFGPTVLHDVRSVSKTIVSLLLGIARQQHPIDLQASPLAFYPDYTGPEFAASKAVTVEHLLTMSSGLEWHETVQTYGTFANDETRLFWKWNLSRYVLSRPRVAAPGSQFNYSGGNTAVLADILVSATDTPLRDFARTALFEPLGIREWDWAGDLYGRPLAFAGLRMRPRDLAKVGRMVLAQGQWHGKHVVPAEWLRASLRPQIAVGNGLAYGYQWWIGTTDWQGQKLPWAAGFGNGGQRLFVVPDLDLTVTITAGNYNDPQIRQTVDGIFRRIIASVRK